MDATHDSPTDASQRIHSLDVLRGFSLLGILMINIRYFALPFQRIHDPAFPDGQLSAANFTTWLAGQFLFEDKMIAIFSMLFGAGILLFNRRLRKSGTRLFYRRLLWLFFIGLAHLYLLCQQVQQQRFGLWCKLVLDTDQSMSYDASVMQTTSPESMAEFSSPADLRRLQDVAENYSQLQGLRIIPIGLFFMASWLLGERMTEGPTFLLTFTAALILFSWIGLYYKRTFGRVRRRLRHHVRDALAVTFFLTSIFLGVWAERRFGLPLSTIWLTVSGLFLYLYFCSGGRRWHYLAVAAVSAVLSLLPALGWVTQGDFFGPGKFLGHLALGLTYILVGIFDHVYLVRSFKPVPAESDADTI